MKNINFNSFFSSHLSIKLLIKLFIVLVCTYINVIVFSDNVVKIGDKFYSQEVVDQAVDFVFRLKELILSNPEYYKQLKLGGLSVKDLTSEYLSQCPIGFQDWAKEYVFLNSQACIFFEEHNIDFLEFAKYLEKMS